MGRKPIVSSLAVLAVVLATSSSAHAKSSGPALAFTPPTSGGEYDYGIVGVGNHIDQAFTLMNSGGSASGAMMITLTGSSAFTKIGDTCTGGSLGPSKKCAVTVRYTPTDGGNDTATLTATSTKPAATASVVLKGTGGVADVEINPSSHDFGSVSGQKEFTATNNGNFSTGTYTFGEPSDSHFGLTGTNTCDGSALPPGGSCTFTIAFAAPANCWTTLPNLYQGTVSLGSYASATVKGEQPKCQPHLSVSPGIYLSNPYVNMYEFTFHSSGSQNFTVTNDGGASLVGLDFSFHAGLAGDITLDSSSDAGDCQNVTDLAVNASCTFSVTVVQPSDICANGYTDASVVNFFDSDSADWLSFLLQDNCPPS
jgi:Cep192 domain 4